MEALTTLGSWIAANESLLSGLVAVAVLAGLVLSPLGAGLRRVLGRSGPARAGESTRPSRKLTLDDLTRPAPISVRFAEADGVRIAYAERGQGPPDLLMAPGIVSHLHIMANLPPLRDTMKRLSGFARVVSFDKRGQGLSDPTLRTPTLRERARDIEAVLDAAGMKRAILLGASEGGAMCLQFAHDHPERVQGLILLGSTASWVQREDYPIGIPRQAMEAMIRSWGHGVTRRLFFPTISSEELDDDTVIAFERLISTRESIRQLVEMMIETDVRPILPEIRAPALVIHFTGDLAIPIRMGRDLAERLPNAEFLEVNATNHADLAHSPEACARVEHFCREVLRTEASGA